MPTITPTLIPTGGAYTLAIQASGTMTLSRAVSGATMTFAPLYQGPSISIFIDVGDELPAPLDPTQLYVYQLTDTVGTVTTAALSPATTIAFEPDPLISIVVRLLQAGINSTVPPTGIKAVQVLRAMPLSGLPPMPFITINQDLVQQTQIPIGQDVKPVFDDGSQILTGFNTISYRFSILATNAETRDFYRDVTIALLETIIAPALAPIGRDITHRYQAASGTVAADGKGMTPGFYYSDVIWEFGGTFNVIINPGYLVIQGITVTANIGEDSTVQGILPLN